MHERFGNQRTPKFSSIQLDLRVQRENVGINCTNKNKKNLKAQTNEMESQSLDLSSQSTFRFISHFYGMNRPFS